MFMLGVAVLIFTSLALAGYAATGWMSEREESKQALAKRLSAGGAPRPETGSILKDQRLSRIGVLNDLLGRIQAVRPLVRLIRQAGMPQRAGEIILYMPLLGFVGFLVTRLLIPNLLLALLIGGVAAAIPIVVLRRMRDKRARRFGEQLPDGLDLIRAALQAGQGLLAAFGVVADEFPEPMGSEMRQVTEEVRLGLPLREALYNLADRVADDNIPILVVGVLVAQEVGGNLAEVVDSIGYTIRERFKLLRDAQVMTAQGRLSGLTLTALPFMVGAFMLFMSPAYFTPMFHSSTGQGMLAYALISIILGHIVIQRIVRIRV